MSEARRVTESPNEGKKYCKDKSETQQQAETADYEREWQQTSDVVTLSVDAKSMIL